MLEDVNTFSCEALTEYDGYVYSRFMGALMECSNEADVIADAFLNNVRSQILSVFTCLHFA